MIEQILNIPMDYEVRDIENSPWKFKILRPTQLMARTRLISQFLGHASLDSVSADDYGLAWVICHLKVAFEDGPDWFKNKFLKDGNPDFEDFPDVDFLHHLYKQCDKKETEFSEAKKKYKPIHRSEESKKMDATGNASQETTEASGTPQL